MPGKVLRRRRGEMSRRFRAGASVCRAGGSARDGYTSSVSPRGGVVPAARPMHVPATLIPGNFPRRGGAVIVKTKIVIADDEDFQRELLCEALGETSVEIVQAESGVELLRLVIDGGPFDLIVTDVGMPWLNGLQVMSSVRRAGIVTPCVFVTGSSDGHLANEVARLGRACLLLKPIRVTELRACVGALTGTTARDGEQQDGHDGRTDSSADG
jgi:CheY-like chemotaxis protein